jgi:hypothetical protein
LGLLFVPASVDWLSEQAVTDRNNRSRCYDKVILQPQIHVLNTGASISLNANQLKLWYSDIVLFSNLHCAL